MTQFARDGKYLFYGEDANDFPDPDDDGGWVTRINTSTGATAEFVDGEDYHTTLCFAGGHLFVYAVGASAMSDDNMVQELGPSIGNVLHDMGSSSYHWATPDACTTSGEDLFVANLGGGITELNGATGNLVRVFSGPAYQFYVPSAIAVDPGRVFVANSGDNTLTAFAA